MKNKIKNLKVFCLVLPGLSILLFAVNTYSSGTYLPPLGASWGVEERNDPQIRQGQELFEGQTLLGPNGRNCFACHGPEQSVPLKRSSLKKKVAQLPELINICVTDPTRSAGKQIEPDSEQMKEMAAYLISKYHLPPR